MRKLRWNTHPAVVAVVDLLAVLIFKRRGDVVLLLGLASTLVCKVPFKRKRNPS